MSVQADAPVLRVEDQRPRYHQKTTYEVIARSGLAEVASISVAMPPAP